MAHVKLLIMGLPGSGKTTLARHVANLLRAVHFDADEVRPELWPELDYSHHSRVESARRIGLLCDMVNQSGHSAVASFICPTRWTRAAFGATHTVWIDRIKKGRFADTNALFEPPSNADLRLVSGSIDDWARAVCDLVILKEAA